MRIQFLSGGLGNEIREYVFVRFLERRRPEEPCFFDDSWLFTRFAHEPEVLERIFGVRLNLLSRYVDGDTWESVVRWREKGADLPQVLLHTGVPVAVVREAATGRRFDGVAIEHKGFQPEIASLPYSNVYYDAYWPEDEWFMADAEENRAELVFPEIRDDANRAYAGQIRDGMSVGIHVRRGDFVSLGWLIPNAEYKESCRQALDAYPDARFFVFSDDLDWCRKNEAELGLNLARQTVYVSGNTGLDSYVDMQLLSMCRGIIRPRQSSFSQVAAWLNRELVMEKRLGEVFDE